MANTAQKTQSTTQETRMKVVAELRKLLAAIETSQGRKATKHEFELARRLAQLAVTFPNGFRRYRVKAYERGEF